MHHVQLQTLVVGIIDYIRTFTWDKRLEMWIKSSGLMGGSGNLPTVVSPSTPGVCMWCPYRSPIRLLGPKPHLHSIVAHRHTSCPAVVYKTRFTDAMNRYFLMVPDPWTATSLLHPVPDEDKEQAATSFTIQEVQAPVKRHNSGSSSNHEGGRKTLGL
jgi:hypothetical protein